MEYEEEQTHETYLVVAACMCRETWVVGAYRSYRVMNPREDWALGYDAPTSDDASIFNFLYVVCGTCNHDLVFMLSHLCLE